MNEYVCIDVEKFENLLVTGQGISIFRVLNYIINLAYAEKLNVVHFTYAEIADHLGYGVRCIGENVRYLCKLGILVKTRKHEYIIDKQYLNVTAISKAF